MSQASHEFKGSVDFNQNELRNATFQRLITEPISPVEGQIYYNTVENKVYYWNNVEWVPFSDKNYVHTQSTPSSSWSISHNLNKKPSVTVIDSGNNQVEGDILYIDLNNIIINFNASFSGRATLN